MIAQSWNNKQVSAVAGIAEDTAEFFKVLGDQTRLRLLGALLDGELCVNDLSATVELSVSAVSHQLALLRRAKLVASRREGRQVFYRLDDDHVATILETAQDHLTEKR